jgi:hypothetical protein
VPPRGGAARPGREAQARAAVEGFVASDLQGRAERYEWAELSPERMKAAQPPDGSEEMPDTGLLFDSVGEPFVAVASARVVEVRVQGSSGTALVEYARVAESEKYGAEVRERAGVERVALRLRHDGRRWWVVDPPPAHVEVGALIRQFEREMTMYGPTWEAQAGAQQKAVRDRTAEGLRVLRAAAARAAAGAGAEQAPEPR